MKEYRLPTHFQFDGQQIAFGDLHKRFAATEYGEKLKGSIRYEPFKPSEMPNAQWEKLLGADVNNFNHLNVTLGLMKSFLAGCAKARSELGGNIPDAIHFSEHDEKVLMVTAITHDWAEAVIGDIPFFEKTELDEKKEVKIYRTMVHEIVGRGKNSAESDRLADEVEDVLVNKNSKRGKAFNANEKVGYTRTGLRAWDQSFEANNPLKDKLEFMGVKVVSNHMPDVLPYSKIYPPIDSYLRFHSKKITTLFDHAAEHFSDKEDGQFVKAKLLWENR